MLDKAKFFVEMDDEGAPTAVWHQGIKISNVHSAKYEVEPHGVPRLHITILKAELTPEAMKAPEDAG